MVVIDSTNLLLMLRPGTPVPGGVDRAKERIDYLVHRLSKAKAKIIIPTPALSEALVKAGAAASLQIVEEIQKHAVFSIEPFDTRAALEASAMSRAALANGNKKGSSTAPWQKVKFDRQIVAIAKVNGATEIYSDDGDIAALGQHAKIKVIRLSDLPLPPEKDQLDFLLESTATTAEAASDDEGG
ncbi:PIN domain-containing protein [Bradyrhizobium sp. Pear77]|uniref:PIN domain-containing protein n=1 Tax=Bradyrhizobium altum TaxID=1571202 RepID=UPI001E2E0CD2|nr:PIN domain-containing protein [Bradyrhizobium altum]MCC8959302.1 PIN domain-containing protein [Bradyrhizobium altum]